MSRSGYSDDLTAWSLIKWRGMVASATRGKRGQEFFRDLLAALDAMPDKRLIANELEQDGEVCAIGQLGRTRGVDVSKLDPEDYTSIADAFGIAACLAQEVMYENDEGSGWNQDQQGVWRQWETPERRWQRMRAWVAAQIKEGDARR